jgi:hypothetical protein
MAKIYPPGSTPIYSSFTTRSHYQPLAKGLDSNPDNPALEHCQ